MRKGLIMIVSQGAVGVTLSQRRLGAGTLKMICIYCYLSALCWGLRNDPSVVATRGRTLKLLQLAAAPLSFVFQCAAHAVDVRHNAPMYIQHVASVNEAFPKAKRKKEV